MLESIKKRIFPYLITLTALSISFIAAYVSVIGLGKLFAGAEIIIMIIASVLEFSKVIIASILYSYRKTLAFLLKIYLTIALIVLMGITSIGIYGFLSGAYSEVATKTEVIDKEIKVYEIKQNRFIETRNNIIIEKQQIDESINSLRDGLANNKTQHKDKETGQILTTSSSSNRKVLETQLNEALEDKEEISLKLEAITDSISNNELKIFEIQSQSELSKELGPLKYISKITGRSMDSIVNWLMILLIFVFDPLAICLVLVSNFTFEQLKPITQIEQKEITEKEIEENSIETKEIIPEQTIINSQESSNIILPNNYNDLSSYRKRKINDEFKKTY